MSHERDFNFTDRDFNYFRRLIKEHAGIELSDAKRDMVYGRLTKRLRALDMTVFKDYCNYLEDPSNDEEFTNFINSLTTNLTSFFREQHHFDYLKNTLFPEIAKKNYQSRKIRIWSAGCSTGEEPYSIAITVKEFFPESAGWDVKILATDLDTNVIETAANGVYKNERVEGLPKNMLQRWFHKGKGSKEGLVVVSSELKELIYFKQLNLMGDWPMKGQFDLIFCRNVVIYFNKDTQKTLVGRYADNMIDNGHLFLGHSESLYKVSDRFKLIGNTIYQRVS